MHVSRAKPLEMTAIFIEAQYIIHPMATSITAMPVDTVWFSVYGMRATATAAGSIAHAINLSILPGIAGGVVLTKRL